MFSNVADLVDKLEQYSSTAGPIETIDIRVLGFTVDIDERQPKLPPVLVTRCAIGSTESIFQAREIVTDCVAQKNAGDLYNWIIESIEDWFDATLSMGIRYRAQYQTQFNERDAGLGRFREENSNDDLSG